MKNLFEEAEAKRCGNDLLAMRVYTSRLLGASDDLVLHGGGNTSVKIKDTLYVKGSGWDLSSIEKGGFAPVNLAALVAMATRDTLRDAQMVKEQRAALRDASAPNPSIEAILHAIIPFVFVDHTHADAIVTLSNTPTGKTLLQKLYGDRMLIVDYVMPGFVLAKHIYELTRELDWNNLDGILLLNHGLFTFDDDARTSYDNMINLVTKAEAYIQTHTIPAGHCLGKELNADLLDALKEKVSSLRGTPVVLKRVNTPEACLVSKFFDLEAILSKGGLTPEHVIRIKPFPAVIDADVSKGLETFVTAYRDYFESFANTTHRLLDLAPRYAMLKGSGAVVFGKDEKEAGIIADIVAHTLKAMLIAHQLGGWQSLSAHDLFEMEYWELEQMKLNNKK